MDNSQLRYGVIYMVSDASHGSTFALLSDAASHLSQPMPLEWLQEPDGIGARLVALRFNIGNVGNTALQTMSLPSIDNAPYHAEFMLAKFYAELTDVQAPDAGDKCINYFVGDVPGIKLSERCLDEVRNSERCIDVQRNKVIVRHNCEVATDADFELLSEVCAGFGVDSWDDFESAPSVDVLGAVEESEVDTIEALHRAALEELKRAVINYVLTTHSDPTQLIQETIRSKIVITSNRLSPLTVNGDMEIVLPAYDEVRVQMPALCRAIYILFLLHRHDGIVLKMFDSFRGELEAIYRMVKPGRDDAIASQSLDNLCNPTSDTLRQSLSRINRCFRTVLIDDELREHYTITGKRGEAYRINLPDDMVMLPRALTE